MKGMGVDVFIDLRNTSYTITSEVAVDAKWKRCNCMPGWTVWWSVFLYEKWETGI